MGAFTHGRSGRARGIASAWTQSASAARRWMLLVCTLACVCALIACAADPTPTPTPPYGLPPLRLPADEAPHDFLTEWWYFSLHLEGETGARFALHQVLFQVREPNSGRTLYVAQASVADAAAGAHVQGERLRIQQAPLQGTEDGFAFEAGDWEMSGGAGAYRLRGSAGDYAFNLGLSGGGEPLLHGKDGLVDFGEAGVSYYYTRTRLEVVGGLSTPSGVETVSGTAWFDKQWGDFQPVAVRWDWVGLQLDDGRDLMLSRLFHADGRPIAVYGTLSRPTGGAARLDADDFRFEPISGAAWRSPATGAAYETQWRVSAPGEGIEVTLRPLVEGAEFRSRALGVIYWEAGVDAIASDGRRVGRGFVELTGRAGLSATLP